MQGPDERIPRAPPEFQGIPKPALIGVFGLGPGKGWGKARFPNPAYTQCYCIFYNNSYYQFYE